MSPAVRVRPVAVALVGVVVLVALASACPPSATATDGPVDPAKYAAYFTRYPFGGRTTDQWRDRLEQLKPGGANADAALYALTVARAQKNGLLVDGSGPAIVVKPDAALTATLMKRLDVK